MTWVRADLDDSLQCVTTSENNLAKFEVEYCTVVLMLFVTVSKQTKLIRIDLQLSWEQKKQNVPKLFGQAIGNN